jgi:hypothetical protein
VTLVDLTSPAGTAFSVMYSNPGDWNANYTFAFDDGTAHNRSDRVIIRHTEADVGYDFGVATNVNAYSIQLPYDDGISVPERAPKTWFFQGSNDKENWETLDDRTVDRAETGWAVHERRFFKFSNDAAYRYYRIYVKSINSDQEFLQFSELEFYSILDSEDWSPDTSGYAKTVEFTVAGVPTGVTLEKFPVLVRLSPSTIQGFSLADVLHDDHSDILFVDQDGKYLPHEIDTWDAVGGEALVWVRMTSLTRGTVFRLYYGASESAWNDPNLVWTSYVGVWHFTGGATPDSSSKKFGMAFAGNAEASSDGRIGAGFTDGVANAALPFSALKDGSKFAVSGWFKPTANNATMRLLSSKATYTASGFELMYVNKTGLYLRGNGASNTVMYKPSSATAAMPTGSWIHYAGVANGATGAIYMNGTKLVSDAITAVSGHEGGMLAFGGDCNGGNLFSGSRDELRVYNGVPSDAWIQAEAQSLADGYVQYGNVVDNDSSVLVMGTPSAVRNADGSIDVSVDVMSGSGTVSAVLANGSDEVTVALSTSDNDFPKTYSGTVTGLGPNKTYAMSVVGVDAVSGTSATRVGPFVYTGEISIAAGGNADEDGLVPGSFVFSRADANGGLVVAYTVGGTATQGASYQTLSGVVEIPDGETSATLEVLPKMDVALNEDATVVLTLASGPYGVPTQASATITVVNFYLSPENNYWIAREAGKASVASNWSRGVVPAETDRIVFDGRISTAACEWDAGVNDLSSTVASWTQLASYTGRVTIPTTHTGAFTNLTIKGNAELNGGEWWRNAGTAEVWLNMSVGGNLTVGEGFKFNGNAAGYSKGNGISPGQDGGGGRGASHGGHGGATDAFGGGRVYGDYRNPTSLGSGDHASSAGGGAISIDVTGDFRLDGSVTADAGGSASYGGASGGSVWIRANRMSGAGTVTARGAGATQSNRYGGGGGRISIQLRDATFGYDAFTNAFTGTISAAGGFTVATSPRKAPGAAGTVYVETMADNGKGRMTLSNSSSQEMWRYEPHTAVASVWTNVTWNISALALNDNGRVGIKKNAEIHMPSFAAISGDGTDYALLLFDGGTLESDIKHDKLVAYGFAVESAGESSFAKHTLVIPDDSSLKVSGEFTVGALIMGHTRIAKGDYSADTLAKTYSNVSGDGTIRVLGLANALTIIVR